MTGPEHYRLAERLAEQAVRTGPTIPVEQQVALAAMAQVHATLALTAATANQRVGSDADGWTKELVEQPSQYRTDGGSELTWKEVLA